VALVASVQSGKYPQQPVVVHAHQPVIPNPELYWSEGVVPLANRVIIAECIEAFREFLN